MTPAARSRQASALALTGSVQVLAYSGTSASNPVASFVSSSNRTTHVDGDHPDDDDRCTGVGGLAVAGEDLGRDRRFSTPSGQQARSSTAGTSGGHTAVFATDGGAQAPAGSVGGLATTINGSAGAGTAFTIVLASA